MSKLIPGTRKPLHHRSFNDNGVGSPAHRRAVAEALARRRMYAREEELKRLIREQAEDDECSNLIQSNVQKNDKL